MTASVTASAARIDGAGFRAERRYRYASIMPKCFDAMKAVDSAASDAASCCRGYLRHSAAAIVRQNFVEQVQKMWRTGETPL